LERFSSFPAAEKTAAPEPRRKGAAGLAIRPGDSAQSLRAEHRSLMFALWTVWLGFVVIACSGYILAEWIASLGVDFSLGKPVLLWLPVVIVAVTGPVWLPLAAWFERRDLRKRLDMVAARDGTNA
jgi:hypothetical protein